MKKNQEKASVILSCTATRADGTPCKARAALNGLCIGHQPGAGEARRQGGLNSSTKIRADKRLPVRLKNVVELLGTALTEVHDGKLDFRQGSAMASLGGAIVKAYEAGVLEIRLTALEKKIGGTVDAK